MGSSMGGLCGILSINSFSKEPALFVQPGIRFLVPYFQMFSGIAIPHISFKAIGFGSTGNDCGRPSGTLQFVAKRLHAIQIIYCPAGQI